MDELKCSGLRRLFGDCLRKPTVERNGKYYCWQHDPEKRAAEAKIKRDQRRASEEKSEAEFQARLKRRKLETAAGIDRLTDADLDAIVALGGVHAIIEKLTGDSQCSR